MSQFYSIINDLGVSSPGNGKEVVDVLNAVDKRYIYQLMSTVQLTVSIRFYSHMQMHIGTQEDNVILAKEFQEHLTKKHRKDGVIDQGKPKKTIHVKKVDRQTLSCSG